MSNDAFGYIWGMGVPSTGMGIMQVHNTIRTGKKNSSGGRLSTTKDQVSTSKGDPVPTYLLRGYPTPGGWDFDRPHGCALAGGALVNIPRGDHE